uniref:MACPF domain-containing protein n=1 Tax=Anguilla anguilla TaxID=7936 RepID=A0A0E9X9U5_ANGAN
MYYNDDEKYYRKPYNFHTYQFMGKAESVGSSEYYEDASSLLNARKQEKSFNLGITVGISMVEFGLSGSSESQFMNNISQYQEQNMGFVRLLSKVQTAQFKMRSSGLMLDEDLFQSLVELPEEYDFGTYSRFLSQYGTHYITSGIMGGVLEYIVVINKKAMAQSEMTGEQAGLCLGLSLGWSPNINVKLKLSGCEKTGQT